MGDSLQMVRADAGWGPAERAALDRCFAGPTLAPTPFQIAKTVRFARTIETEIIPRLLLAHREVEVATTEGRPSYSAEVAELASAAMGSDPRAAMDSVEWCLRRGRTYEDVLLDLMAPAARLLGDMWREDLCTFTDVTIGLSRLQQILRAMADGPETWDGGHGRRILLAPVPGEQHSFGISMVEEFFRREGWQVDAGVDLTIAELGGMVRNEHYDVIGLSLSCEVLFPQARRTIRVIREASRNPSLLVMVGGRLFLDDPTLVDAVGADTSASDAAAALRVAKSQSVSSQARC